MDFREKDEELSDKSINPLSRLSLEVEFCVLVGLDGTGEDLL